MNLEQAANLAVDAAKEAQQSARLAIDAARIAIKERDELAAMLEECLEYFEDREDVNDGDYGAPEANEEMRWAERIREALGRGSNPYWVRK